MTYTLIVPLDGSELAERALPYAVRLAVARGGGLVLARAAIGPAPSGPDWERQQVSALEEAEAYIAAVAEKLSTRVPVRTAVTYGHAVTEILATVKKFDGDGIVVATHGRTGLTHLLHGSVAEAVLAHSSVPVFVVRVRPGEAVAPPFDPVSARIMVPLDGSTIAEAALPTALEMRGAAGELVLVCVVAPPDHVETDEFGRVRAYLDQQEEAFKRDAHDYLRRVGQQLRATTPDLKVAFDVRVGKPAEGIVMATADRGGDLVVMVTHGRTGIRRAVMGSVAGAVLRMGLTPVLLVRATAAAGPPTVREPVTAG